MRRLIVLLLALLMLFSSCTSKNTGLYTREIYAMNTIININVPRGIKGVESVCNDVVYYIYDVESKLSAYFDDSDTEKFNRSGLEYTPKEELLTVMRYALDIAEKTEGAYDPTCMPLTKLWNVTEGGYLPDPNEVRMALAMVGYEYISIDGDKLMKSSPTQVDLGGIAKGYALDNVVKQLSENLPYGMVSFGGNVGVWGEKPDGSLWEIGIKNPFNTEGVVGKIRTSGGYVSVSGDYERFFEYEGRRYHHIFDPKTGYPVDNGIRSVAVYTTDAAVGDALSTALFVMGYDKAMEFYNKGLYDFEALFITNDDILMTKGMEEMFTYEN